MSWYEFDLSKPAIPEASSTEGDLRWPLAIFCILAGIGLLAVTVTAFLFGAIHVAAWSLGAAIVLAAVANIAAR